MILTLLWSAGRLRPLRRRDPVCTPGVPYEPAPTRQYPQDIPAREADVLALLAAETARTNPLNAARLVFAEPEASDGDD